MGRSIPFRILQEVLRLTIATVRLQHCACAALLCSTLQKVLMAQSSSCLPSLRALTQTSQVTSQALDVVDKEAGCKRESRISSHWHFQPYGKLHTTGTCEDSSAYVNLYSSRGTNNFWSSQSCCKRCWIGYSTEHAMHIKCQQG